MLSKFSDLKLGDTVLAKIITRRDDEALLDIGGRRIRAIFQKGVPEGNSIELILAEKNSRNIVFTLTGERGLFRELSVFKGAVVLPDDELNSFSIYNLVRFISSFYPELFDISLFLLGFKRDAKKIRKITHIFKNLAKDGVDVQTLSYFSLIFSRRFSLEWVIFYIYFLLLKGNDVDYLIYSRKRDMEENILSLLSEINEDNISVLSEKGVSLGEGDTFFDFLILPDDYGDDFTFCEYICHGDNCIINFNFSLLGKICVIIKFTQKGVIVNFFVENQDILILLEEKKKSLSDLLAQNGIKNYSIGYYNMKKIVDKIFIWSKNYSIKSGFDVKR